MFLEIVADAGNVGCYLHAVCKANSRDFSDGRVWFLRSFGRNFSANSTLERRWEVNGAIFEHIEATRKCRRLRFASDFFSFSPYELVNCGHFVEGQTLPAIK